MKNSIRLQAVPKAVGEVSHDGEIGFRAGGNRLTQGIEHAAPDHPVMEEFVLPRRIYDCALALAPGVSNLDFDIEGKTYSEPPGGPPFDTTGSLDIFLRLAETPPPDPEKDVDDEETEIPD